MLFDTFEPHKKNPIQSKKVGYRKKSGDFISKLGAFLNLILVLLLTSQPSFAKRPNQNCDDLLIKQKNARFFEGVSEEEYKANRVASLKKRLEQVPSAPAQIDRSERAEKAKVSYIAERTTRVQKSYSRQPTNRAPMPAQTKEKQTSNDLRDRLHDEVAAAHRFVLSYREARTVIMGTLDYHNDKKGSYVWDVYCQRGFPIHQGEMPSPNQLNIEHTWPQSRFTPRFPREVQKADLHHLFPTDSIANGLRGHMKFGEVVKDTESMPCQGIHVGLDNHGQIVFEAPTEHKGDLARALFYFSVRYNISIDADEEAVLRTWHQEDPVSPEEMERNNKIEKIQGNRNPFVDNPEYVQQIANF